MKLSIIVPTYNERDNLPQLLQEIHTACKGFSHEILVIDDDSPDKTWQAAQLLRKKYPVQVIRRVGERGLVSAIQKGIHVSKGEIIGWLDADLSHPPQVITHMMAKLRESDAVIASRYLKNAADKRSDYVAILFSLIINWFARTMLYSHITDYTSGFILVRRKAIEHYRLTGDYGEFFIRLIIYLIHQGYRISEVPYVSLPRKYGYSKTAQHPLDFLIKGRKYVYVVLHGRLHR